MSITKAQSQTAVKRVNIDKQFWKIKIRKFGFSTRLSLVDLVETDARFQGLNPGSVIDGWQVQYALVNFLWSFQALLLYFIPFVIWFGALCVIYPRRWCPKQRGRGIGRETRESDSTMTNCEVIWVPSLHQFLSDCKIHWRKGSYLPQNRHKCKELLELCCVFVLVLFSCSTMSDSFVSHMDCSLPGSSVHGISQARILEWGAISFSKRSSWPRDWTHVVMQEAHMLQIFFPQSQC